MSTRIGWRAHALALLVIPLYLAVGHVAPAQAQMVWDTPRLIGPESPTGFGVHWVRSAALGPELDAGMITFGLPGTAGAVSLRGGAAQDQEEELSVFGGIDLRAHIATHSDDQPLDIAWTAGIGAGAPTNSDRVIALSLPMAIAVGRSWSSGSVWAAPYVSLGVAFDLFVGSDAPEDEFDWSPTAAVGLDLALDPGRRFVVRVGASLGDRHAFSVGLNVG